MDRNTDHLSPDDRFITHSPCTDPAHQKAIAEAAELRRLVDALVSNACSRDLAAALRQINDERAADEALGEAQFEAELTAAEFRRQYEQVSE